MKAGDLVGSAKVTQVVDTLQMQIQIFLFRFFSSAFLAVTVSLLGDDYSWLVFTIHSVKSKSEKHKD